MTNLILDLVDQDVIQQLELTRVDLPQQKVLSEPAGLVTHVYFPTTAVVSLVVALSTGETIEAAMVGRDGVVGAAAALNGKISLSRAMVQISGIAMSCTVDTLKRVAMQNNGLHSLLIRHEQVAYAHAQQSAACNLAHTTAARLSRWMLRARDLSRSDMLPFTQEFLGDMLGVERSTLSLTANTLQQAGMITYRRGRIQIVDAEALQDSACECYSTIKSHYDSLLGDDAS